MPDSDYTQDFDSKPEGDMPFLDHVEELRWRLIKSIIAVAVMGIIAFIFADRLYSFVTVPLGDTRLHFTEVTGSFYAYLKLAFFVGIIAAAPIVLYQLWSFVGPGLYESEKRAVIPMVFFSFLLFLIGASFCFFIVLPIAIQFLLGYGEGVLTPIITVSSYISFAGLMILAFGVAFELPVVGYFLGRIGLVTPRFMSKGRAYAIVVMLIAGAVLSPPDIFTQVLLAVPLILLYEITIIIVKMTGRKKQDHA
ncbi:MAG: twin-arginine translocase subunit TatC [Candidatus Zixiibacteriota bacterium]|nr:MAG: twin-arginine translocase subunit TatC [candidate division Zixibacteria bacterium]